MARRVAEEQVLFPAFERSTGMLRGPTEVMRSEHVEIRRRMDAVRDALRDHSDARGREDLAALIGALAAHDRKEERVLYPMADRALRDDASRAALLRDMQAISRAGRTAPEHHALRGMPRVIDPQGTRDALRSQESPRMIQLVSEELASRSGASLCPDCPMTRADVLASLIPPKVAVCAFRCLAVRARSPLPARWFKELGLGVVRRGIVVRQRLDAHGRATAVDVVGAGGLIPLAMSLGAGDPASVGGYAVSDALICACPVESMRVSMEVDRETPRDVLRLHAHALERMERLADARGRATVAERIAATLLALADNLFPFRRLEVVPVDLQQADLAALVSARQETVCRALGALERQGLIARSAEGVGIVDRQRLEAV